MTNYEEIKNMTIDEMTDFFDNEIATEQGTQQFWQEYLGDSIKNWLKSEAYCNSGEE